ncbi:acetyl-CoA carboxylase biotin carboxyl carrier protein [Marinomonas transparens]|uniref:Biotin carboxyl carrier protein of acetyl-CoA carboxylase n=1 Tax=Marinomonas transparens TaxID=2795388 RepID=A0A934JX73_9GAMM|nr:biotin/lipoyl-containing protein [Marinomonas transparens]MBJ7538617.1 biotin/lipoyl-binding protein [Marinomonas transparens]
MDPQKIKSLVELMSSSDLEELIYREGEASLTLSRTANGVSGASSLPNGPVSVATFNENIGTINQDISPSRGLETTADSDLSSALSPALSSGLPFCEEVQSPLHGVVYLSPSEGENAYVSVGDSVTTGQTLCLLEAMKMFHPIQAEVAGKVREICVQSGDEVASGQSLFLIDEER